MNFEELFAEESAKVVNKSGQVASKEVKAMVAELALDKGELPPLSDDLETNQAWLNAYARIYGSHGQARSSSIRTSVNTFKTLVNYGAAPYLNNKENGPSYFAVVADSQGEETLWGVDIERSLEEAGANIGDDIQLTRGGKEPVLIKEKQADGSLIEKMVDRNIWNTIVQKDEIELIPASRQQELTPANEDKEIALSGDGLAAGIEGNPADNRFAILPQYWLNGLHNHQGIALAEEVNAAIRKHMLEEDREAVIALLAAQPNARRLGLAVVRESDYLNDPFLKANIAEPRFLLAGAFVRDQEGAYRPAGGGVAVLQDKGDSLVLKSKSAEGYRAAMELAVAKGWTAIELKGKPAMLANAWLEAKMIGLDVVNYSPTKEDLAKYSERVAADRALRASEVEHEQSQGPAVSFPAEQGLEQVEVHPYLDADGVTKVAQVFYSVSREGGETEEFDHPKDAARAFLALPDAARPLIVRSTVRADGIVQGGDIVAMTEDAPGLKGRPIKSVDAVLAPELNEAIAEVRLEERARDEEKSAVVSSGIYSGTVLSVKDGIVTQRVGRSGETVRHAVSKLSKVPKEGAVEEIGYVAGLGRVRERGLEKEGGLELG